MKDHPVKLIFHSSIYFVITTSFLRGILHRYNGVYMEKFGRIFVWALTICMLFSIILSGSIFTVGNPLTEVTLDLQDESPKVDVSPGSSGMVTITGSVTCKKWGPDLVKVYLTGNSSHGDASVIPHDMVFDGSAGSVEERTFSVYTRIPKGTSCYETITVTISGYYVQGSMQYEIEPVSIEIIVLQYYRVEVFFNNGQSQNFNTTVKSGSRVNLEFLVHNAGNGNDRFEVDFEDREEWENEGFGLPDPIEISLKEKRNKSISWTIKTPADKYQLNFIMLQVSSLGSRENGGKIRYLSPIYIRTNEHTITDRIGSVLFSPLVILLIIVISLIIIVVWFKKR